MQLILKIISIVACLGILSSESYAQRRFRKYPNSSSESSTRMTYDIGASTGSYDGQSYSEITLGFNYYFLDQIAWRNAIFNRFGSQSETVLGVDTSLRYSYDSKPESGEIGYNIFGGPGYRIASAKYSGAFLEAGAVLRFGGLSLGAGLKTLSYSNPGKEIDGSDMPKSDTVIFIILAGGGAL